MKQITHPQLGVIKYPDNITIVMPESDRPELAFILWEEKKYGRLIPEKYKDIWNKTFPYLRVRSTDVHTAVSLEYLRKVLLPEFRKRINKIIDPVVCSFGIILHDCGWSQLTPEQISWTFQDIKGSLDLDEKGKIAKKLHLEKGYILATKILEGFSLMPEQKKKILQIVRYHDFPERLEKCFSELDLTTDADRIWSYTTESFWLDVCRKTKPPKINLTNLEKELDGYFRTKVGKELAKKLLNERRKEVKELHHL